MSILDRYIIRSFLLNFAVALTVMIGLYVLIDFFFNLDEFTEGSKNSVVLLLRHVVDFYSYNCLLYFAQLTGVITVIAACFTLARMHHANELTAVLASGTSLHRVAWPVVLAGLFMNGLWVIDQELILPRVADKLARRHDDIDGRNVYPVYFLPDRGGALLSARRFLPQTGEMRGLVVMRRDPSGQLTDIVRADSARWDPERRQWSLTLGVEERMSPADPGASEPGAVDPAAELRRPAASYASDLTPTDIVTQQAAQWATFLSFRQISEAQRRFANDRAFLSAKHLRLTTPFVNIVLLLMGISFFLTRERVSLVVCGGRCLLMCGACFVFTFFAQNSDFTAISSDPALPIWLPVLVFGPVAVYLLDAIRT